MMDDYRGPFDPRFDLGMLSRQALTKFSKGARFRFVPRHPLRS